MSLKTRVKKVNMEGIDHLLTIDMLTIQYFKDVTGKSFLQSISKMAELDEDIIFPMMGGMLRTMDNVNEPVGVEYLYKYDPIALIQFVTPHMKDLLMTSMPKGNGKGKVKKK